MKVIKGGEIMQETPHFCLCFVDEDLRGFLKVDVYGFYKKEHLSIPLRLQKIYKELRKQREYNIFTSFYGEIKMHNKQDIPFYIVIRNKLLKNIVFSFIYKLKNKNRCYFPPIYDIITLNKLVKKG